MNTASNHQKSYSEFHRRAMIRKRRYNMAMSTTSESKYGFLSLFDWNPFKPRPTRGAGKSGAGGKGKTGGEGKASPRTMQLMAGGLLVAILLMYLTAS